MNLADIRQRVQIDTTITGADDAKTKLDAINKAQQGVTVSSDTLTRSSLSVSSSYERLVRSIDPVVRAQDAFEKGTRLADKALAQGATTADGHARVMSLLQTRYEGATKANDNHAKAVGLAGYQWKNLGLQANDAATMLLSGASAFQVVATQGGQVLQVLQDAQGGVGGALKSIATRAGALLTPANVAGAALAALGAGAVIAFKEYSDGQSRLEQSQLGLGRASGATVAHLNDIAAASAGAGRVSVSTARDMIAGFSSTGKIGQESFGALISASRDYAKITGQDVPDAAQELAKALADPAKGFEAVAAKMGGLDGQTLQLIRSLDAQGDSAKAQKVFLDAMAPSLDEAAKKTNAFADAWEALKRKGANAVNTVGNTVQDLVHGPDASQRSIDNLNQQIKDLQAQSQRPSILGSGRGRPAQDRIDQLSTQRDALMIIKDTADREARDQAQVEKAKAASIASVGIIDSYLPSMADQTRLEKFASTLQEALDAGKGPAGADTVLKKVRDQLAAGGTEAYNLSKASRDAFDLSKLQGYAREMEAINQKYRDQIDLASKSGNLNAVGALVIAKGQDQQSTTDAYLRKPSSYYKGVGDAPDKYRDMYMRAGRENNVDPDLLAAMGYKETGGFRPDVISGTRKSSAGAVGIAQFMPGTASRFGVDPTDPQSSITGQAKYMRTLLDRYRGDEGAAVAAYNAGEGRIDKVRAGKAALPDETRDYVATILKPSPDTKAQVDMLDGWRRGTEELTKANEAKNQSFGRSPFDIEKARIALDLETQAKAQNRDITDGLKKAIDQEATARARSVVNVQQTAADRSISQSYAALGRTPDEQSVYRSASQYAQEGTAEFDRFSEKFRDLQTMTQAKDLTGGAVKGLVSDLMHGTSAADAFKNALGQIGDKLASKAIDSMLAPLFGGGGKDDTGGIFGALIKGLGGAFSKGFADGGYTGHHATDQIAGVVHGKEYVFDAASTNRIGVGTLDAIRSGVRGYADGGYVPSPGGEFGTPAGFGEVLT